MSRYDIEKFDPPPDPDLVCCICQCVLDKAVECPCRHVFCQSCIERWLSNRHTCPTCRKRTRKQDLKPVLPLVQNMLNRLMMICEHKDNGCIEKIMLEHFERHIKNCGYEMKTCRFSKCGIRILRMHLDKHENEECEHREMVCEGECGLMIPLSERPSHNCVAALKAHIDEKNRMIEQLKVKLHELNNLSQSLNDQLVELRQQLNDRTHIFSSASSDSSESDVTDFMSDDLSRDSFRDSWFDSAASNISGDIVDNAGNAANNDVNQGNNNTAGHSEGSDVVEQVERTVVNSLFELSSRLERVRNQMRAVLNSRLVQDQNNLNDEVRIPSAAELDAIVNHGNNDNNNTAPVHSVTNPPNSSNMNDNQDDYRFESQQNRDSSNSATEAYYVSDDDNHLDSHTYSSYANDNQERNFNEENQPANTVGSDVSDLNWISDTDTNYTAEVHSPNTASSPVYERYTPFRNENHNYNNQYISEHVILSQPPDSPSDTTGSFSSIPSTSSVAFSPLRSPGHEDSNHDSLSATQASNDNCSPAPSDRGFTSSDNNSKSPRSSVSRSPDSHSNDNNSEHGSASFTISSPAHSVSSIASTVRDQSSKSEASHVSSDEEYSSSANRDSQNESKSSVSESNSSESQESDCEDVRNVSILHDNKEENHDDARNVDRSLDYDHDESHEVNENTDHHIETSADDISHQEEEHNDTDDVEDNHHQNDTDFEQGHVSRCEPDSTQSPLAIQQHQNSCTSSSSSENQILISTATESTDSEDSDSLKYLTKRIRRSERTADVNCTANINNYHIANESSDPSSTVDSGFITGSNSPSTLSQPLGRKSSGRKRKYNCNNEYGENKDRVRGDTCRNDSDQKWYSHSPETVSNNLSYNRYGFKKRVYDNDHNTVDSCKKVKASGVSTHHLNNQTNSHRSRTSPPRNRQQWREPTHHLRRNRTSLNRWDSQSNDNNGQSLNVKIDLSLINYSGHIGTESAGATIPTATVVHSANISPIPTASSVKRDTVLTNSRQNLSDDNVKSSTPKQEDATKRSSHRQRSSRAQRHDTHNSMRNSNNNSSPVRGTLNVNNTSSRDFPNSWRDSSESSSDNTWEPASDCDEMDDSSTEADDGFETESSYEVQIPKSTAALLEEYASDESDESWTVGMN